MADPIIAAAAAPESAPAPTTPAAGADITKDPGQVTKNPGTEPPLAELIRQEREARTKASQEAALRAERDKELETLREKVKGYESEKDDIILDTIGYFKARGLEDRDLATVTEALAYHLVPEKADAAHRARMVEAQVKRDRVLRDRKDAAAARAREEETAKREAEAHLAAIRDYHNVIDSTAKSWAQEAAPPFPVSQEWFSDDHQVYVASLAATAKNLAEEAQAAGKVADLSPRNVARVLEEHLAKRVARTSSKVPAQQVATEQKPAGVPTPPTGGAPKQKPANVKPDPRTAERERIQRAAEVVFKT